MSAPASDAVVLLSGGMDSATTLALAINEGHKCHALTFRYGQRHEAEVNAAARLAKALGAADHRTLDTALGQLGGSALTDRSIAVPLGPGATNAHGAVPPTYVPARNTIFLSYALALAEATESDFIYIGVNSVDYSGYPDCRPQYVEAFQSLAALATRRAVEGRPPRIVAPLQHMDKADIIRKGLEIGVDYSLTLSCYAPDADARACGRCASCAIRRRGFREAGVPDPTLYQPGVDLPA